MQYQNLDYVPGFVPVYSFVMKSEFDVPIDATGYTWKFEAFACDGTSLYTNTSGTISGSSVAFSIPVPTTPIFLQGNYSYRVSGTNTTTNIASIWVIGFITVEPFVVLPPPAPAPTPAPAPGPTPIPGP